jgi:hypothetical protein
LQAPQKPFILQRMSSKQAKAFHLLAGTLLAGLLLRRAR